MVQIVVGIYWWAAAFEIGWNASLKFYGYSDHTWWWVLFPLWLPGAAALAIFLGCSFVIGLAILIAEWKKC